MLSIKLRFLYRACKARFRDQAREISELLQVIQAGDTVLDIGANKGSYLWWLSRSVGPGRVVAFEPQKQLADYLKLVCKSLGLNNVTIEQAAVSEYSGETFLNIPGECSSPEATLEPVSSEHDSCRREKVRMVSLDEYITQEKPRVSAIKMDVEGHELAVFRGAVKLLQRHSPLLLFESENRHQREGTVMDVLEFLKGLGYRGSFIMNNRLLPIEEFDPSIHQRQEGPRYWDLKGYCNNFVMTRDGK